MTILDRVTMASTVFLIGAGLIIATAPSKGQQPTVDRTGNQLCNEVKHELDIQVREGMFPAERAEQVYQRCIKFYGDSK